MSEVTAVTRSPGSLAKAALVGAKTVKGPSPENHCRIIQPRKKVQKVPVRVSARPAWTARSMRVEAPFLVSSSTMFPAALVLVFITGV